MLGERSVQLFRILGIRVGASPSWFLALFLIIWWTSDYFDKILTGSTQTVAFLIAVAASFLFFASLLLHELGHALVARRLGIGTSGIELWLFGGVANLSRDSQTPGEEFKVAAAGPAVTALIVGASLGAGTLASHASGVIDTASFRTVSTTPAIALLGWLGFVNLTLLIFNLVPAFPLDGGRIARAVAWRVTGDRNRATRFSARIGQLFGWLLIGIGVLAAARGSIFTGLQFGLLGWFLSEAARGAVAGTRFTERLDGVTAGDLMDEHPVSIPSSTRAIDAHDEYFGRFSWPWFAVVDEQQHFLGILQRARLDETIAAGRPALSVGEVLGGEDADSASIGRDAPVESLLGLEAVRRLGAVMVVDPDGRLCGVLTAEQLGRALSAAAQG